MMTPQEFKSWFEGFTEALPGTPTKAQWARIKERVAEIDGKPITERHFIDRYWPSYYAYYPWSSVYGTHGGKAVGGTTTGPIYTSNTAMYSLGQLEAKGVGTTNA